MFRAGVTRGGAHECSSYSVQLEAAIMFTALLPSSSFSASLASLAGWCLPAGAARAVPHALLYCSHAQRSCARTCYPCHLLHPLQWPCTHRSELSLFILSSFPISHGMVGSCKKIRKGLPVKTVGIQRGKQDSGGREAAG